MLQCHRFKCRCLNNGAIAIASFKLHWHCLHRILHSPVEGQRKAFRIVSNLIALECLLQVGSAVSMYVLWRVLLENECDNKKRSSVFLIKESFPLKRKDLQALSCVGPVVNLSVYMNKFHLHLIVIQFRNILNPCYLHL